MLTFGSELLRDQPGAAGDASLVSYLCGEGDEDRQRFRDELLGTTVDDFRAFADVLAQVAMQGRVVVLGSAEAIVAAGAEEGG